MDKPIHIFWFRRDLRLEDNAGLSAALQAGLPVLPLFVFDTEILNKLSDKKDKRVQFIHTTICQLQQQLQDLGSSLRVIYGTPAQAFEQLLQEYSVRAVFTNHDYEPYALQRDQAIDNMLQRHQVAFHHFKDQVIFEKNEVIKDDGKPYTVFTPFSKKWKARLTEMDLKPHETQKYFQHFIQTSPQEIPSLESMGFVATPAEFPPKVLDESIVMHYSSQRDIPGIQSTSHMGVHLRFGTVSIRSVAQTAKRMSEVFLNELIWRDFYHMILWQFPQVANGKSFKPAYDYILWRHDEEAFEKWCAGTTGYPIVDAGMRELNTTGFMHNRVRMIVASFLCKHLLLDWRWGEAYFAEKLLDFDFAANNGGWQWAAGSGCDAAPYFRIFNPYLQTKKFDPDNLYIKKWVPEFDSPHYPAPIVVHEEARKRCLEAYAQALKNDNAIDFTQK